MSADSDTASPQEDASQSTGPLPRWRAFETQMSRLLGPFALLAVRLVIGYALLRTGWGKFGNLEGVTSFFSQLGIPMPGVNAAVVAGCELVGGGLIMLGLFTRSAAAVLSVVLAVALFTAHMEEAAQLLANPSAVVGADPAPFLAVTLLLGVSGAGLFSVDRLLKLTR